MDYQPDEIARQMTILDNELFQKVDVRELYIYNYVLLNFRLVLQTCTICLFIMLSCIFKVCEMLYWAAEQNEEKSPMLTQFTMHFNNVSKW